MGPVLYHQGKFPPKAIDWEVLIPLLGPAAAAVARYDGLLGAIPSPMLLLSPLSTQEAVLSSRIEGTQATMGEVLEFEAGQKASSPEKREDIQEILNYRRGMHEAERLLNDLPLSQRVIKEVHKILLDGVRGRNKAPGDYRKVPNWIGPYGCTQENARFVPISAEKIDSAMSAWEKYAHEDAPDRLVQLAIMHAEFESLHPFLDGNGRLGRMLVPLFMWQVGLIKRPMFYISAFFEARRDEYYNRLLAVSAKDDWTGWCEFFLSAVKVQAEENLNKTQAILSLHDAMKRRLPDLTRSQYAIRALDWLFSRPVFKSSDFVAEAGIPAPTARRFLAIMRESDILKEVQPASGQKSAVFAFSELLNTADGNDTF